MSLSSQTFSYINHTFWSVRLQEIGEIYYLVFYRCLHRLILSSDDFLTRHILLVKAKRIAYMFKALELLFVEINRKYKNSLFKLDN